MKKIFLLAAAALALAACDNNEDNLLTTDEALQITASIGESVVSRAADASWAKGDKIGILSTIGIEKPVAGPYVNLEYTTDNGDGVFKGTSIFFYKPMTLIAYYPFTGVEKTAPGTNGVISVTTNADAQKDLPLIDFLWDSKTGIDKKDFSVSNPNVNFTFAHKMSKLTFTFQSSLPVYDEKNENQMVSDGVDVRTMVSYTIEGLGITGTFNTATGVCAVDETKGRQGLTISFNEETVNEIDKYKYTRTFPSLIVFPQSKPDNGFILHITTRELKEGRPLQDYKCSLPFDGEIKPGYHYKFNIMVSRRGLFVGDLTIEEWDESQKFIVATIDGDEAPKETQAANTKAENQ